MPCANSPSKLSPSVFENATIPAQQQKVNINTNSNRGLATQLHVGHAIWSNVFRMQDQAYRFTAQEDVDDGSEGVRRGKPLAMAMNPLMKSGGGFQA